MKQFVTFALIFGGCIGAQNLVWSQTAAAEKPKVPDATQNLIGKKLAGWIVPQKYWMNTPQPIWLGGLQDQITVIEFFRINCTHCQDAAPAREALYRKYRARGLKMVGFHSPGIIGDTKDDENKWDKVKIEVKKWGLTYPIAFDKDRAFFDKNEFRFYPTVLVLDRKGIVKFQQTGYSPEKARDLEQFVSGILSRK